MHAAKEAASNATLTVEIAKQSFEELQLKINEKLQQFTANMQEIGFESYEAYATAKRSVIQLDALRKACSDYALQVHTLQIQITEGATYLQGREARFSGDGSKGRTASYFL